MSDDRLDALVTVRDCIQDRMEMLRQGRDNVVPDDDQHELDELVGQLGKINAEIHEIRGHRRKVTS